MMCCCAPLEVWSHNLSRGAKAFKHGVGNLILWACIVATVALKAFWKGIWGYLVYEYNRVVLDETTANVILIQRFNK